MKGRSPTFKEVALDIVGSTKFGRYPKISIEETFNMIISDDWLVPYAGHLLVDTIVNAAQGRAIFTSVNFNHMIVVIGSTVYSISDNLSVTSLFNLLTSEGDVFIDENYAGQIAICDQKDIWIYNWKTDSIPTAPAVMNPNINGSVFIPGYISYQNGRFLAASVGQATWRLSVVGDGTMWPTGAAFEGSFQTKPDYVVGCQRFPGRGNLCYIFGSTVVEPWQDVGAPIFPYQKNSSVNVDYGCLNPATIAYLDSILVWLAGNEKSGPMIAYSTGGDIKKISTDGIDFKLATLTDPSNSYGFLFRQDGHLLYQITFPDDNLTYVYDFNTEKFFTLTNENYGAHIAKKVAFFNDNYYFISFIDGNLYQMGTQFTTYNGAEIPRRRICRPIRLPDASRFAVNNLCFTIEQGVQPNVYINDDLLTESGQPITTESGENITVTQGKIITNYQPLLCEDGTALLTESGLPLLIDFPNDVPYTIPQTVGLSVSRNGGQSFGTIWNKDLNANGNYRNRLIFWNLGAANEFIPQIWFKGLDRFVATDGIVSIYQ